MLGARKIPKPPNVLIGFLLPIYLVHSSFADVLIRDDMGGPLGEYLRTYTAIRDSGERVIIDGNCYSACTLVTIIPKDRICITQRAELGFHAGWVDGQPGGRITSAEGTRMLYQLYPPMIRGWISKHGGLGVDTIVLKGRDLAAFYSPCK
jgi:hypothetical protein